MTWIVGVDVGGTFTDVFAVDRESGETFVHKLPSQPRNPAEAILRGLESLATMTGLALDRLEQFSHGTTVGTNALIERSGADVALITTDGFRDLLEIGRQTRPGLYDLQTDHPAPLVPRKHRFEVVERLDSVGDVLIPLTERAVEQAVAAVRASGASACAVCLLFAFRNG
ncbi:MAG: hydantoinase/oxoprolinase family protein, partial [Proteobacteria bacterium]|nr:hydantoinase/oxoprolinase family protein [Pseudomonadota bacterium]